MLPALILTLAALLYRLLFLLAGAPFDWANFSPLASIFLCSGVFFATKRGALWPALGLLVSDVIINAYYHAPLIDTRMIPGYFCFAVIYLFLRNSLISDPATCSLLLSFCLLQPFSGYTTRRRISPDILPIPLFKYAHSIAVSRRIPIDYQ